METNNISNDYVFAHLTDKFDDVPSDVIFDVCTKFNWKCKLFLCLVKLTIF